MSSFHIQDTEFRKLIASNRVEALTADESPSHWNSARGCGRPQAGTRESTPRSQPSNAPHASEVPSTWNPQIALIVAFEDQLLQPSPARQHARDLYPDSMRLTDRHSRRDHAKKFSSGNSGLLNRITNLAINSQPSENRSPSCNHWTLFRPPFNPQPSDTIKTQPSETTKTQPSDTIPMPGRNCTAWKH